MCVDSCQLIMYVHVLAFLFTENFKPTEDPSTATTFVRSTPSKDTAKAATASNPAQDVNAGMTF